MSGAHLRVDWTRCDGHGLCAPMWPDRIVLDEWGFPVVAPDALSEDELPFARRTAGVCPKMALWIDEGQR